MIRLKVFVSSVQKELRAERQAVGSLLATDEFLRSCTVPRIFEEYPAPLQPNPKVYLDLLRTCHIYLLIIWRDYGEILDDDLSATHQEYRLAQALKMPTLVCVRGERSEPREDRTSAFLAEIKAGHHTYSRFGNTEKLLEKVRDRLKEHIRSTYDIAPMPGQDAEALQDRRVASDFERRPIAGLSVDDLRLNMARQMMAEAEETDPARWSDEDVIRLLLSRGYLWWDGTAARHRPTIAGALLLAKRPARAPELTQARLQLEAYAGDAKEGEPLDAPLLDVCLPEAVEQAVAFVRRNSARPLVVKGLKRQPAEPYPAEALREAAVNAVAHRDYAEAGAKVGVEVFASRVRVSSPGLPPGGQSVEILASGQAPSRARNPLIVQGLTWLGLMDERGSGIRRMKRVMELAGHPPPRFTAEHGGVIVELEAAAAAGTSPHATGEEVMPSADTASPEDIAAAILAIVDEVGHATTASCVQKLGIARDTAWRTLSRMVEEGILKQTGTGRGTKYRRKEVS
ncbi:MAG: ATP-binding protein [bacterium]|nr:ATP-binding protein [bacterium]